MHARIFKEARLQASKAIKSSTKLTTWYPAVRTKDRKPIDTKTMSHPHHNPSRKDEPLRGANTPPVHPQLLESESTSDSPTNQTRMEPDLGEVKNPNGTMQWRRYRASTDVHVLSKTSRKPKQANRSSSHPLKRAPAGVIQERNEMQ